MDTLIIPEIMRAIPGVAACGLIDLDRGGWIELEYQGAHPEEFRDYLALHATALFEGDAVRTIKSVLRESPRATHPPQDIEEIIMRSGRLVHYFRRLPDEPRIVVSIVTDRSTRMGLVLAFLDRLLDRRVKNQVTA